MAGCVRRSSGFQNYPYLNGEEFAEVCHHLDRKYCQATLGPVRRQWRLRVCTALSTSFALDTEYTTYVHIVRPLDGELDDGGLATQLDKFSLGPGGYLENGPTDGDKDMIEAEEADEVCNPPNQ